MGEAFYKLAALYLMQTIKEAARNALGPTQFALAPGGSEAAVLYLRTALSEHPSWTIMACDIKNAFNTRNRGDILQILYQHQELSPIWKLADWAYGNPTDLLLIDKGRLVETIPSSQGVKQGDALSSLLFALSMTRLYSSTAERAGVRSIAVQDDVYFLGPMHSIVEAWNHFNDACARNTGLVINQRKTSILVPPESIITPLMEKGFQPSTTFIPALGTILTRDPTCLRRWLAAEMRKKHKRLFEDITDRRMPAQVAFTLLRMCAIPLVLYWMRTSPPSASATLADEFDELVAQAASSILAIPTIPTLARQQLTLPVSMGGFGLRSMSQLADAAWISAQAQAARYAVHLLDNGRPSEATRAPLEECLDRLNKKIGHQALPYYAADFWAKFVEKPAGPGMQKEIMTFVLERMRNQITGSPSVEHNAEEQARWVAVSAQHAGLWITTTPSHYLFRITSEHYRTAARIRLGLAPHEDIRTCQCGWSLTHEPLHFLNCKHLFGHNTLRHNRVVNTLTRVALMLHTEVMTEQVVDHKDGSRVDAVFFFRAKPAMIDVTVVNPLANTYVPKAAVPLGAAKFRERQKNQKYEDRAREAKALFFPFVVEATGGLGPQAEVFIRLMAEDIFCHGTQSLVPGDVKNFIRKVVSFALCAGNGLLVSEGLRRARSRFEHY